MQGQLQKTKTNITTALNRGGQVTPELVADTNNEFEKISLGLSDLRTVVHAKDPAFGNKNLELIDATKCFTEVAAIN